MHCFSLEELSTLRLSRFQISYIKQCKQGDKLRFYRKRIAEKEYLLQGINEMEELVLQARLLFVEDEGVCQ